MRQRLDDAQVFGMTVYNKLRLKDLTIASMTANVQLTADSPTLINLDPTAARDLLLPPVGAGPLTFIINHLSTGAFDVSVKDSAGVLVGTLSQGEAGIAFITNGKTFFRLFGANT